MDREGIERLYEQYAALVYRTCLAILLDHHDAEDAAQEVFAKLLIQEHTMAVDDPRKWLLKVTRNHCIDRRRAAVRRRAVTDEAGRQATIGAGGEDEDAEWHSVARAQINWLLAMLPRRQREVMVHQAVLDEDLDTVAAKLGISYGAAAQLVHRARRLLAQANEGFRAGIAVVGGRLGALRRNLRALWLRPSAGGRALVRRLPTDPALALPAALLIVLLGSAPPGAVPPAGAGAPVLPVASPSATAQVAAVQVGSASAPVLGPAPAPSTPPPAAHSAVSPSPGSTRSGIPVPEPSPPCVEVASAITLRKCPNGFKTSEPIYVPAPSLPTIP
jgi:RNA polymerase sigma-70 factor, ECF subfamily